MTFRMVALAEGERESEDVGRGEGENKNKCEGEGNLLEMSPRTFTDYPPAQLFYNFDHCNSNYCSKMKFIPSSPNLYPNSSLPLSQIYYANQKKSDTHSNVSLVHLFEMNFIIQGLFSTDRLNIQLARHLNRLLQPCSGVWNHTKRGGILG